MVEMESDSDLARAVDDARDALSTASAAELAR